jgi:hypothetical protein
MAVHISPTSNRLFEATSSYVLVTPSQKRSFAKNSISITPKRKTNLNQRNLGKDL